MRPARWIGLLGLAASLGGPVAVRAQGPGEAALEMRRAELETLQQQIATNRREIERLRQEGQELETLLSAMERERVMVERYVRTLATQESALAEDIAQRRTALEAKQREIEAARRGLAAALVRFYKQERVTAAELLVSAETFGEIFTRGHYWARAVQRLRDRARALAEQRREQRDGLTEVEARRTRVLGLRREREQEAARMRQEESARRAYRAQLSDTIARYEEQTRKLLASQAKIERLIAEAQQRAVPEAGAGLAGLHGRLSWPVRGRVIRPFGTRVHPKYGTRVRHKGIVIAAEEGLPIQAVAGGRVVFVGWLEGYGRTVILDHGQGWFSLYAHASATLVGQDDTVVAGQEIAQVGSTDSLDGASLHFEIRQGSEAHDPALWLTRGGGR